MPAAKTPFFILPIAALTLAACNGGGGGSTPISAGGSVPRSFEPAPIARDALSRSEIAEISRDIFEGVRDERPTPKDFVPLTGEADYYGTVQMDIDTPAARSDVAGLVEMNVDFRDDRVRGVMGNFVEADGDDITGALSLRNGRLDRTANSREVAIFSDFGGRLTGPGGERIAVDGDLSGGFAGDRVGYIGAELDGAVTVDGVRGTLEGLTALER